MSEFTKLEDLECGRDRAGRSWEGERCKSPNCRGRRNVLGFDVDDETWERVVQGRCNVLCLACFDEMAQDLGVEYEAIILGRKYVRRVGYVGIVGLSEMTAGERLELFREMAEGYCRECGEPHPSGRYCQCWNDE